MKRERLPRKRERFRDWKVFKHIEDGMTGPIPPQGTGHIILQGCGSSIAHGRCIYAGHIVSGHTTCDARKRVWQGCPFQSTAQIAQAFVKLEDDAA